MTTPGFLPPEGVLSLGEADATLRTYRDLVEEALARLPVDLTTEEQAAFRTRARGDGSLGNAMVEIHQLFRRKGVARTVQLARRSFIVAVAAATEEQARVFCDALQAHTGGTVRWKDLRDSNPLNRLKKCLCKPVDFKKLPDTLWLSARRLQQIRDCIVHANGEVDQSRDKKELRAIAGKVPGYAINADGRIVLGEEAGPFAIRVLAMLFTLLYEQAKLPGLPLPPDPPT